MPPYLDTSSNYAQSPLAYEHSPAVPQQQPIRKMSKAVTARSPIADFQKPLDKSVVKGKTAIVHDGASGLGLGLTTELAENGCKVAMLDDKDEAGRKAEKELTAKGYQVKFVSADTSKWDTLLAGCKEVLAWSEDQLDIVITSPGIVTNNLLLSVMPDSESPNADPPKPPTNVFEIDLIGVYYMTSLALFYFNKLKFQRLDPMFRPQICFVCSMAGFDGLGFGTDYAAAKHGVRAIWKTVRRPSPGMARYQANLIAPTYIQTKKIKGEREDTLRNHNNQTNEIEDVVAGAMRCICDETVEGRAICCCQGSIGEPGSLNFDLCDDVADHNGGREILEKADDIFLPSSATLKEGTKCAVQ